LQYQVINSDVFIMARCSLEKNFTWNIAINRFHFGAVARLNKMETRFSLIHSPQIQTRCWSNGFWIISPYCNFIPVDIFIADYLLMIFFNFNFCIICLRNFFFCTFWLDEQTSNCVVMVSTNFSNLDIRFSNSIRWIWSRS